MGSGALSNVWSQAERLSSSCVLEPTPHYPVYQSRSPARPRLSCSSSSSSSNSRIVAIVVIVVIAEGVAVKVVVVVVVAAVVVVVRRATGAGVVGCLLREAADRQHGREPIASTAATADRQHGS
jgi:hypothetical protein